MQTIETVPSASLQIIDSHQHFWKFDAVRDSWITEDMKVIQRDFLPADLAPVLQENGVSGCVAVQAGQSEAENEFLLSLANNNLYIKGIVGWVDLRSDNIQERLEYYSKFSIIKGFRHVLQGEADRGLMLNKSFMRGIAALQQFDFTYDILIYPDQLPYVPEFVSAFPKQKFVIDHLAKPEIKKKNMEEWEKSLILLQSFENVSCKISGMVTEADWNNWKTEDLTPCIDAVAEVFGPDRIMFGSDWPVCLVAASYRQTIEIVQDYFSSFLLKDREKFFGKNAIKFYNLK